VMCLRPVAFVAQCLTNVRFPRRYWVVLSPVKFAAALGLLAGIWVPFLGLLTAVALVGYFVVALSMHIAARDLGRDLFVNASGMLLLCLVTLVFCFVL
jgi:uncharacterized membrane protein YkgB